MIGVLAVLVFLCTFLSNRACRTAASGTVPRMRYLVALTLLNLPVLGLPLGFFGSMGKFFGVGAFADSPAVALVLIFLALSAVLFFVLHTMTFVAATKIRRLHARPNITDAGRRQPERWKDTIRWLPRPTPNLP